MSKPRTGDIYIYNTNSGGTIQVINGEPEMDGGFESAAYLSLFGNNGSDFWGNEYATESQKLKGQFIGFIESAPITLININRAQDLALLDLQWFIDDGIADTIGAEITEDGKNRIELTVDMQLDGNTVFENTYQINWQLQKDDPATGRIV